MHAVHHPSDHDHQLSERSDKVSLRQFWDCLPADLDTGHIGATEDVDLKKQMDAKGTEGNWVGPEDFYKWAGETYAAHAQVAIKIGMWKK
jgi:hypothetical protein